MVELIDLETGDWKKKHASAEFQRVAALRRCAHRLRLAGFEQHARAVESMIDIPVLETFGLEGQGQ